MHSNSVCVLYSLALLFPEPLASWSVGRSKRHSLFPTEFFLFHANVYLHGSSSTSKKCAEASSGILFYKNQTLEPMHFRENPLKIVVVISFFHNHETWRRELWLISMKIIPLFRDRYILGYIFRALYEKKFRRKYFSLDSITAFSPKLVLFTCFTLSHIV